MRRDVSVLSCFHQYYCFLITSTVCAKDRCLYMSLYNFKFSVLFAGATVVLSPCGIPDGRLVSQCRAGAVPGAAPCRASPSVHRPQLLPQGRGPRVPSLPGADGTGGQGGRAEEGPVLPQQPPGWPYVGARVVGGVIRRPVWRHLELVRLPGGCLGKKRWSLHKGT